MLIRHGEPDYEHDTLTPKGHIEAELLAEYLVGKRIDEICVSPLGRAQATAAHTLEKLGRTAETLPWLREFPAKVRAWEDPVLEAAMPYEFESEKKGRIAWDILPEYLAAHPDYFHPTDWRKTAVCAHSDMIERYDEVVAGFDAFLAAHGYVREGGVYRTEQGNDKVIAMFCHFGVECVLLAHLMGVSPFALWHGFVSLPTGVTVVNTEERVKGIAWWRVARFGDLSHLEIGGKEPSFFARFCERFEDDTLH